MAKIDILLATYNGTSYLPELLASLDAQSLRDWRLIVRDDGSSDDTVEIIRRWQQGRPDCVVIIEDGERGLGASGNFARLLEHSTAPYFSFCDQDDIWLPEKLERSLAAVEDCERRHPDMPVLVHHDLSVVGCDLSPIAPSFWRYQKMDPELRSELRHLLIANVVTGCASIGNAALRRAALPIPEEARMHDWWLALVAATQGRLECLAMPLVLYRQHDSNTVGATAPTLATAVRILFRGPMQFAREQRRRFVEYESQSGALLHRFHNTLPSEAARLLEAYATIRQHSFLARRLIILRNRMFHRSFLWNASMMLAI